MIPPFDAHGVLPPGVHACTLDEIAAMLCFNPHRRELLGGLRAFISDRLLPDGLRFPLYVDGSFVRSKALPDDIDVVLDLMHGAGDRALKAALLLRFRNDELKRVYHVDFWFRHPEFQNDLAAFFQYLGDKAAAELRLKPRDPKGILRVEL